MDQSVYVRHSIESLVEEGVLGAVLCSLVILLFLGEWRMTVIAVLTIPIAVLASLIGLYATGNTINVMTLAGLSLAIGPMVDSAIICLENTHRHLGLGASPEEAAFLGASEVAMPELVASLCTLLVLAPLALMPGLGEFLYRPMAAGVAFAMIFAYLLSRSFVPARSAQWLKPHAAHGNGHAREHGEGQAHEADDHESFGPEAISDASRARRRGMFRRAFALGSPDRGRHRLVRPAARSRDEPPPDGRAGRRRHCWWRRWSAWVAGCAASSSRRSIPAPSRSTPAPPAARGSRRPRRRSPGSSSSSARRSARTCRSSSRSWAWSPTCRPPIPPTPARWTRSSRCSSSTSASTRPRNTSQMLRDGLAKDPRFRDLEFAFDAGGMIRSAMNEGKSSPINIRLSGKNMQQARSIAETIKREVAAIDGVVDARIIQRLDYPEYIIEVDRAKVADLRLNQAEVMKNVVAALNSSIQFHKKNFWIDPVSKNQYFVGVQYFEEDIDSVETLLDVPITGPGQDKPIPLRNIATLRRATVPTEITHNNLQSTIDLTMGVSGRDLGHVADDVARVVDDVRRRAARRVVGSL